MLKGTESFLKFSIVRAAFHAEAKAVCKIVQMSFRNIYGFWITNSRWRFETTNWDFPILYSEGRAH